LSIVLVTASLAPILAGIVVGALSSVACTPPPTPHVVGAPAGSAGPGGKPRKISREGDFAPSIPSREVWDALSYSSDSAALAGTEVVKVIYDKTDGSTYFLQSERWPIHYYFARRFLNKEGRPVPDEGVFNKREYHQDDRRFILGTLSHYPGDVWAFELYAGDQLDLDKTADIFHKVQALVFMGNELKYRPVPAAHDDDPRTRQLLPVIESSSLFAHIRYQPLELGEAFGFVRIFRKGQPLDTSTLRPFDLVVLASLPEDLPVVSGVISDEIQAPLGHINVLCHNRATPNMMTRDATLDPAIVALEGKLARLTVEGQRFRIEAAGQQAAEASWEKKRPQQWTHPTRDDKDVGLPSLAKLGLSDIPRVGAKTAQLGLVTQLAQNRFRVPRGFALPMAAYTKFLRDNGFDKRIDQLLSSQTFLDSADERHRRLDELRADMLRAPVDARTVSALSARIRELLPPGKVRLRSSTNAEDLPGFNGAGLYRSTRIDPADPNDVLRGLREVWSSVWLWGAFEERQYYRIDSRTVGMAILVQESVDDDVVNGVAVTENPFNQGQPAVFINAQTSGGSVTGARGNEVPEQILAFTYEDGQGIERISQSSRVKGPLLTTADIHRLVTALDAIHAGFTGDTYKMSGSAVDVEFLLAGPNRDIVVVQARPYNLVWQGDRKYLDGDGNPIRKRLVPHPFSFDLLARPAQAAVPLELEALAAVRLRGGARSLVGDALVVEERHRPAERDGPREASILRGLQPCLHDVLPHHRVEPGSSERDFLFAAVEGRAFPRLAGDAVLAGGGAGGFVAASEAVAGLEVSVVFGDQEAILRDTASRPRGHDAIVPRPRERPPLRLIFDSAKITRVGVGLGRDQSDLGELLPIVEVGGGRGLRHDDRGRDVVDGAQARGEIDQKTAERFAALAGVAPLVRADLIGEELLDSFGQRASLNDGIVLDVFAVARVLDAGAKVTRGLQSSDDTIRKDRTALQTLADRAGRPRVFPERLVQGVEVSRGVQAPLADGFLDALDRQTGQPDQRAGHTDEVGMRIERAGEVAGVVARERFRHRRQVETERRGVFGWRLAVFVRLRGADRGALLGDIDAGCLQMHDRHAVGRPLDPAGRWEQLLQSLSARRVRGLHPRAALALDGDGGHRQKRSDERGPERRGRWGGGTGDVGELDRRLWLGRLVAISISFPGACPASTPTHSAPTCPGGLPASGSHSVVGIEAGIISRAAVEAQIVGARRVVVALGWQVADVARSGLVVAVAVPVLAHGRLIRWCTSHRRDGGQRAAEEPPHRSRARPAFHALNCRAPAKSGMQNRLRRDRTATCIRAHPPRPANRVPPPRLPPRDGKTRGTTSMGLILPGRRSRDSDAANRSLAPGNRRLAVGPR
jgi:rifampicin phosphotransferase